MAPGDDLVKAANRELDNPNVRAKIRQMHAEEVPLVTMVDELGLKGMTPQIRATLSSLDPDVVAGIRQATLQMLDSTEHTMPLKCSVKEQDLASNPPLTVEVKSDDGRRIIHISTNVPAVS